MASSRKPEANANDITSVIQTLAAAPGRQAEGRSIAGPKRAAMLMLALGEQYGGKIWQQLDDDEVRELSLAMSTLGTVEAETVEDMLLEFVSRMSASGALMGNFDATERLLQQYLPPERVNGIMDEIRGPAGRNMWEKLSNVQEEVLANYLKNEYPQTDRGGAVEAEAGACRARARDPARGHGARRGQPHAQDGSGAEGGDRERREDAARRVHVEPVADPPPRRP